MLRKRTTQRFIAWLAIAAMALLAFAPTVSRTLLSPTAAHDMGMGMAMDHSAHHASHGHRQPGPDAPSHDPTDACGYCSLISHSPAVLAAAPSLPPALAPVSFSIALVAANADSAMPLDVHSRGPPRA